MDNEWYLNFNFLFPMTNDVHSLLMHLLDKYISFSYNIYLNILPILYYFVLLGFKCSLFQKNGYSRDFGFHINFKINLYKKSDEIY